MAVAQRSGQEANATSSTNSTSLTLGLPGAPLSGNLLVLAIAADKNSGSLSTWASSNGFLSIADLPSTSVTLYLYRKVSAGTEQNITPTWATASPAGATGYYFELEDSAVSGSDWQVSGSATNITSEANAASWPTGTTGTLTYAGLGIAIAGIDSSSSIATVDAWGNSYTVKWSYPTSSGRAGLYVASKAESAGTTTNSTFNYTPVTTADQTSAAIAVFAKVSTSNPATAAGQMGWGTMGAGNMGPTFGAAALTVPDAPTIGTATAGNASATVTFTAPSNNGGSAILDYRITSSPGGITETVSGTPGVIDGLTNGQAYTFTVQARNAQGYSAASAASNSVTPAAPTIGKSPSSLTFDWTL